MLGFNRIILSRKGFDKSAGGGFSPFDPDTGKYIVLPIPQAEGESYIGNKLKYEDIKIKNGYFEGYNVSNLKELMDKIRRWPPKINGEKPEYAHFDPWLGPCPWLEKDSNHCIGAFGQVGGAQTTLCKNGVSKGSLFLFFSRFKPINWTKTSRFNDIDISPEHLKEGLYFIYGWLKVGEVIDKLESIDNSNLLSQGEKTKLKEHHPHATPKYFEKYENKKGKNTIYIADKCLFDNSSKYSGCGYFTKLNESLLLTATDPAQKPFDSWIPSRWKMPPGLSSRTCLCYLKNWLDDNLVQHKTYGQEFVFSKSEEFCQWFNAKLLPEMRK